MIPFGPQLIGETEKSLNALLGRVLTGKDLTEPHWVSLRLTAQLDGTADIARAISERAHFANTAELIADLTDRGLVADGRLTEAGQEFLDATRSEIEQLVGSIWDGLSSQDIETAGRVLNSVQQRARALLTGSDPLITSSTS